MHNMTAQPSCNADAFVEVDVAAKIAPKSGIFRQDSSVESSKKQSKSESLGMKGPDGGPTAVPGHMTCR